MNRSHFISCPKCQADSGFKDLEMEGGGTGMGILFTGGLLSWLLHSSSQKGKLVCTHCGYAFSPPLNLPRQGLLTLTVIFLIVAALLSLGFYWGNR